MNASNNEIMLSVFMMTYNHEKYIAQALKSILAQKVNFKYEIIVGEDCSKDRTREIVLEYAEKNPKLFKVILHEKNIGASNNQFSVFSACTGKYIAFCEGDDIWIDYNKLLKQVNFLESNPEFGLVYTDVKTIDMYGNDINHPIYQKIRKRYQAGYIFTELLKGNFINTCTAVIRKELIPKDMYEPEKNWFIYDYWLWLRIAINNKVHFVNEVTSCYRIHENSISRSADFRNRRKSYYMSYDVLLAFNRENNRKLTKEERIFIFRKLLSLLIQPFGTINQKISLLKILPSYFPGIIQFLNLISSKLFYKK